MTRQVGISDPRRPGADDADARPEPPVAEPAAQLTDAVLTDAVLTDAVLTDAVLIRSVERMPDGRRITYYSHRAR